jgi:hypothetical protein
MLPEVVWVLACELWVREDRVWAGYDYRYGCIMLDAKAVWTSWTLFFVLAHEFIHHALRSLRLGDSWNRAFDHVTALIGGPEPQQIISC